MTGSEIKIDGKRPKTYLKGTPRFHRIMTKGSSQYNMMYAEALVNSET